MSRSDYSKALGFIFRRARAAGINEKRIKLLMAMDEIGKPAIRADIETLAGENMNYDAIHYLRDGGLIQHKDISKGSHRHYSYEITEKGKRFLDAIYTGKESA
jgi:chromosome segregation and condensation protein ScpB